MKRPKLTSLPCHEHGSPWHIRDLQHRLSPPQQCRLPWGPPWNIAEATIIVGNDCQINKTLVILSIISPNKNRDIVWGTPYKKASVLFIQISKWFVCASFTRHPVGTPVPSQSQQKTPLNYGESAHFKTTGVFSGCRIIGVKMRFRELWNKHIRWLFFLEGLSHKVQKKMTDSTSVGKLRFCDKIVENQQFWWVSTPASSLKVLPDCWGP